MKNIGTIILAAGKGTRMKSDVPKVLHPVCGKPLIRYVLEFARAVGSSRTCVVLGHQRRKVAGVLGKDLRVRLIEQKRLLGTADAVRTAQSCFKGFRGLLLILSGDAVLLKKQTLKELVRKHRKTEAACTFLTTVIQNPSGYGRVIRGFGGKAVAIREEKDATDYEKNIMEINAGVYCFDTDVLFDTVKMIKMNPRKKEYYLTDIISLLAAKRLRIETLESEDPMEGLGINTREDLARAEDVVRRRVLKDFMLNGVTVIDPATTYICGDVRIGRDTVIRPFTVIEHDVRIGSHCVIGPFARIRPGSRIGNNVELGNFTEVSRSRLGRQCLMKHFSFLGDSRLGKEVNIGAGVVTANYDGRNKNITTIGDGAFIGSDSILVAPVKVGKGSVTGAGCVVTRGTSVPAGGVVAGIPARPLRGRSKNEKVRRKAKGRRANR